MRWPLRRELLGEIADDVLRQAAVMIGDHRAEVVLAGPLDGFLRAGERHPHRRMRLLIGPRPDRDVLVGPELALVGELRLGPGLQDDLDRLLEARPRFRHRHAIDVVFARHAAGEARQDAPARHASRPSPAPRRCAADCAAASDCRASGTSASWSAARRPPPSCSASSSCRAAWCGARSGRRRRSRACPSPPRLADAARRSAPRPRGS